MAKGGKNLKSALQSQQNRLKAKQKIAHATQVAEQKARRISQPSGRQDTGKARPTADTKWKSKTKMQPTRRPTIPFKPSDKILLIGEGNFSFARSLIQDAPAPLQDLPPGNVTATTYDSEEGCYLKYPQSQDIVSFLRTKGVEVIFDVDATRLEKHPRLKGRKWDRVSFNFPHAGKGIADQDRNILSNQLLILGFLRSAAKILQVGPVSVVSVAKKKKKNPDDDDEEEEEEEVVEPHDNPSEEVNNDDEEAYQFFVPSNTVTARGTILITLRNVIPYTQWDVPRLAKNPPENQNGSSNPKYTLLRSFQFHRNIWKGYKHRMTKGERAHGKGTTGEGGEDRTWEFHLKDIVSSE